MADWRQAADAMVGVMAPIASPTFPVNQKIIGWPTPDAVHKALRKSPHDAIISIYPHTGSKLTSRYNKEAVVVSKPNSTITTAVDLNLLTITLGGGITLADNVFVYLNHMMFGRHVIAGDTLASIATALANSINATFSPIIVAVTTGPVISLGGPVFSMNAAALSVGTVYREVARITRRIMVSVWCGNNTDREAIAIEVVAELADAEFLDFADGSKGRILYDSELVYDGAMAAGIMRSDSFWAVEYPVFKVEKDAIVGCVDGLLLPNFTGGLAAPSLAFNAPAGSNAGASGVVAVFDDNPPSGAIPGNIFTLSQTPNIVIVLLNLTPLRPVPGLPGANEYVLVGNQIVTGDTVEPDDVLRVIGFV